MHSLTVHNLGPIEQGRMEFGDLTIIFGDNNTGKSYLATAAYGYHRFLQQHLVTKFDDSLRSRISDERVKKLREQGEVVIAVPRQEIARDLRHNLDFAMGKYVSILGTVFATDDRHFRKTSLKVDYGPEQVKNLLDERFARLAGYQGTHFCYDGVHLRLTHTDTSSQHQPRTQVAKEGLLRHLAPRLLSPPHLRTYFFSSIRGGSATYHGEVGLDRHLLPDRMVVDDGRGIADLDAAVSPGRQFAWPILDELRFLREVKNMRKMKSPLRATAAIAPHKYVEAMMAARYEHQDDEIRLVSNARTKGKFDIPLELGSAAARELMGLYFYLKHLARAGDLIFIDEPETHLSSGNLIQLAQLISELVCDKARVVLSTHSEVLLKELNNLIMFAQLNEEKSLVGDQFPEYKSMRGLPPGVVKAYRCARGKVHKCQVTKFGVVVPLMEKNLRKLKSHSVAIGKFLVEREP